MQLEIADFSNYILLVNDSTWGPFESSKPIDGLQVITISPESMEVVIRACCDIGVVTEKSASELITGVYWMSSDGIGHAGAQVANNVI